MPVLVDVRVVSSRAGQTAELVLDVRTHAKVGVEKCAQISVQAHLMQWQKYIVFPRVIAYARVVQIGAQDVLTHVLMVAVLNELTTQTVVKARVKYQRRKKTNGPE